MKNKIREYRKGKVWWRVVPIEQSNDEWEIRFWQAQSVKARFSAAWKMLEEYKKLRGRSGKNNIKFRLRRSIENLQQI